MAEADRIAALLQRLEAGGVLRRLADGAYAITGLRGKRARVVAGLVTAVITRGLVRVSGDGLVLSEAGRAWLADGARQREQHQVLTTTRITDERGREGYVVVNCAESPLSLLSRLGLISAPDYEAGEKLRRDYEIGQLTQRLGVDYSTPIHNRTHRPDMGETALAARQRFNAAMKAVGPGLSDLLFDVCCYLKGLEDSEKARRWPRGSAKVVLRLGLARLAAHYGFGAPEYARSRAWAAPQAGDEDSPGQEE